MIPMFVGDHQGIQAPFCGFENVFSNATRSFFPPLRYLSTPQSISTLASLRPAGMVSKNSRQGLCRYMRTRTDFMMGAP